MSFFEWVQQTTLAEWMRFSINGYPTMITLHAIGLAVMVGISVLLCLRMLGVFKRLPIDSLRGFFRYAWIGLVVNTISGVALWTMQAVDYVHSWPFMIKITGVFVGAGLVAVLQRQMANADAGWRHSVPLRVKLIAVVTIIVWTISMVAGRLIAYPGMIFEFLAVVGAVSVLALVGFLVVNRRLEGNRRLTELASRTES